MKTGTKITILGAGNVGASIAYTLTMDGMAAEILLIDINQEKALGEAMDIVQGTSFASPIHIHAGDYADAAGSDIVIVTVGLARKPGMTRIDLAQSNVNIVKSVIPEITRYAPDAIYVIVSNPVDIITYTWIRRSGIPESRIIGSGTMLDSTRLRTCIAEKAGLSAKNVHGFVLGEHGDTSVVPWSLLTLAGMPIDAWQNAFGPIDLNAIYEEMQVSGAQVIQRKGATYYAIALSVRYICDVILRDTHSVLTLSTMMHGQYGMEDVCLSLPFIVGASGIIRALEPPLAAEEQAKLIQSAEALKTVLASLEI